MRVSRGRPARLLVAPLVAAGISALTINAWSASAAPGADESTFVPVLPARVLDTRDPTNVGLAGPFVSAVAQDLKVTGSITTTAGTKVVVPAGATGVALNVTVVGPSSRGFLSIRPADAPGAPTTSNLNFEAGAVTPNSVTVQLPTSGADAGKIEITFDAYGQSGPTTDVLIDVVGYTTKAGLADLQSQIDGLSAQLGSLPGSPTTSGLQTQLNDLRSKLDTLSTTQVTNLTNQVTEIREILETMDVTAIRTQIETLETILASIPSDKDLTDVVFDGDPAGGALTGTFPNPSLADGAVTAVKLADGSVTAIKLADAGVTSAKILDGTITASDLANGAVTTVKLADGSITSAKLAPGVIDATTLADGSVTTIKLVDGSVNSVKILDGSITAVDLADGAVTTVKLANGAVTTAKIAPGSVTTIGLADGSVTTAKLGDSAVTSAKIADGTIANADLADASITSAKLAPASVTGTQLAVDTITTPSIRDGVVTSAKIMDGQVLTADLAIGAVDASKLNTRAVTLSKLDWVFGQQTVDVEGVLAPRACAAPVQVPTSTPSAGSARVGGIVVIQTSRTSNLDPGESMGAIAEGGVVTTTGFAPITVCNDNPNNISIDPGTLSITYFVINP